MQPISANYLSEAVAVTGLDRAVLEREGASPKEAMNDAKTWIEQQVGTDRPVLVGFPLVFDWMFLTWYLERFAGGSPFGYSSGLDMKTLYATKAGVPLSLAGKDDLPPSLRSSLAHTHNALDDAMEQGEIFIRLFNWDGDA